MRVSRCVLLEREVSAQFHAVLETQDIGVPSDAMLGIVSCKLELVCTFVVFRRVGFFISRRWCPRSYISLFIVKEGQGFQVRHYCS